MKLFVVSRRGEIKQGLAVYIAVLALSRDQAYKAAMAHNCKSEGATTSKWLIQECDGEWDGEERILLCQKNQ